MLSSQINFGPLTFHYYGLVIAIAVILGWSIAKSKAQQYKIPEKLFEDKLLLIPLILSIVFARLYHVADYWSYYQKDVLNIFQIQKGGLGIWGALFGLFLGIFIIAKIKKINFLALMDAIAPGLLLAQAVGRVGNYINQEGFGPPTNLPWKVYIEPGNRPLNYIENSYFHPTFFYEAILELIFFIFLTRFGRNKNKTGVIFALYLILYSTARIIAEYFRIDTWQFFGVKVAYILCFLIFSCGVLLLVNLKKRRVDTN